MRQLIRRLRTCEAGIGTAEYALLIAVVAIGLFGVLALFSTAVGRVTNRTTVSVSAQSAGGYGTASVGGGEAPSGGTIAYKPPADEPDSAVVEPDSSGAGDGTPAVTLDLAVP